MDTKTRDLIQVEYLPPLHWWQSAKWKLLQPYVSANKNITVPKDFITDGATIFILFRWLFSPTGKYFGAAIIHDYIIVTTNDFRVAKQEFESELEFLNIIKWRRKVLVAAVSIWKYIRKVRPDSRLK